MAKLASNYLEIRGAGVKYKKMGVVFWDFFWYFWLTIQNTTTSQARSLFRVAGVFISFCPWRALLLLWQLRIFAAAAARRHPTPPPFLGGGK
jgi:hypothetical protein